MGALLAIPAAGVIQVVVRDVYDERNGTAQARSHRRGRRDPDRGRLDRRGPELSDDPFTIAFVGRAEPGQVAAAAAFEDEVLALLPDHGARLVYRGRRTGGQDPCLPAEVHLIWFPSRTAFAAYLADERRQALLARHGEVFTEKVVVELDEVPPT